MFTEYTEVLCPFCEESNAEQKGKITLAKIPSFKTTKRASLGKGGSAAATSKSKEENWVESSECPVCHKTNSEIEKKFKEREILVLKQPKQELTELEKLNKDKQRLEGLLAMGYKVEEVKQKIKDIQERIEELSK